MTIEEAITIMEAMQHIGAAWRTMNTIVKSGEHEQLLRKILLYYLEHAWGCDTMVAEMLVALFDVPPTEPREPLPEEVKQARVIMRARLKDKKVSAGYAKKIAKRSE